MEPTNQLYPFLFDRRAAGSGSVFGSSEVNHETWRAVKYLRGHDSDVQDLAWSNDNRYIASCGVDGFIIIWDAVSFGKTYMNQVSSGLGGCTKEIYASDALNRTDTQDRPT